MGEMSSFRCPDETTGNGYLASAGVVAKGNIVVIQEWWGLNDQMKMVANRCAAAGYNALVPDLYKGRVTHDPDEAGHMMVGLDWVGATKQDVCGAARHLKKLGGAVAVMGYCLGGALTIIAAAEVAEIDLAICYYGIPPADAADPASIRVPFQGHFASQDDWCTPQAVDNLESELKSGDVNYELYRYDAAHAFFNASEPVRYDEQCAELSWRRVMHFLAEYS